MDSTVDGSTVEKNCVVDGSFGELVVGPKISMRISGAEVVGVVAKLGKEFKR